MPSFINDLWIISKDGIPLIEIFNNTELDGALLGALLSAIESFSEEIGEGTITSLGTGKKQLVISPCLEGNVFLVTQTDASVKEKKIQKIFKILADFFEELYTPDDILDWDGDLGFFDKYKDRIDIYFKMYDM